MSKLDEIIKVDKNGTIVYTGWVEWQHMAMGIFHCPTCLVLDKCWFNGAIMPQLPQHEKCHCTFKTISNPIPMDNARALCDISKFKDYIFGEKYEWNGKRKLFEILGFTKEDSEYLQKEYEAQATKKYCASEYTLGKLDFNGQRINIDIEFNKNGRKIVFDSGWMVRQKGEITNNTPLAD